MVHVNVVFCFFLDVFLESCLFVFILLFYFRICLGEHRYQVFFDVLVAYVCVYGLLHDWLCFNFVTHILVNIVVLITF